MPQSKALRILGIAALILAFAPSTHAVDFEKEIWPIIETSCVKCHMAPYKDPKRGRTKNPKAGLRFDTAEFIMKGAEEEEGEWEKVIVPGKPSDSSFYTLITLDEDHDDVMPPKGDLLTKAQQELIKKWITDGAKFGSWTKGDVGKIRAEMGIKE
ncbi:MAG: hypothetical protein ACI8W8_004396 [Rhodothermales bacterium]|jgi:hypothetical protein